MLIRVKRKKLLKILELCIIVGMFSLILFLMQRTNNENLIVKFSCIGALVIFIYEIIQIYLIKKKLFIPEILFLLSFYLFQNGQLILLALGIEFNDFYILTLQQYNADVATFSAISTVLAGLAAYITTRYRYKSVKKSKVDMLGNKYISNVALLGFWLTFLVAIPLILVKARISLSGGYTAVRAYEGTVPSILGFVEYMFMPFSVLCLVYCSKKMQRVIIFIVTFWAIITALCGDRTTGIGALVLVLYVHFSGGENANRKKMKSGKKILSMLGLLIGIVCIVMLIQVAYTVRTQGQMTQTSFLTLVVQTISDLGFSCFPLYTMMNIIPGKESFLFGKGYLLSFVGGCIPSFLDVSGVIAKVNTASRIFETWQEKYYGQYAFGFGFSLNAEAYINFGWYGLIVIFFIMLFITNYFNNYNEADMENKWGKYKCLILLFLWFTLPRRDSYYIWKAIAYSIVIMEIILFVLKPRQLRKRTQIEIKK